MRKTEKKAAMSLEDKSEKSRRLEALSKSKYSLIKNEDSLMAFVILAIFDYAVY